jgi:glycine/D-amino acid oxidase-like deaminating enzyme
MPSGHPDTYYTATVSHLTELPPLQGSIDVDVAILGAGFTGINTALELQLRGYKVAVLEAQRVGWGASGRNGGELIRGIGHNLEQFRDLIGQNGIDAIGRMGFEAVDIVRERIRHFDIDCDLQWGYADLALKSRHLRELEAEKAELERLSYPHELTLHEGAAVRELVASDRYIAALSDPGSGHLHPLKLLLGEAEVARQVGVSIYENTPVIEIRKGERPLARTPHGDVHCDRLIVAGNAYLGPRVEPWLGGKVLPAGSYIIATEPLSEAQQKELIPHNMAFADLRVALDYFHLSADGRLLFGGRCNYSGRDPHDIAKVMQRDMEKVFPQLKCVRVEYYWGGMIGIGANRMPQLGTLPDCPSILYAQAYAGHGLNATHLAARLIAEKLNGQPDRFDLFARIKHRTFPGGPALRSPLLALGMLYHRFKDLF